MHKIAIIMGSQSDWATMKFSEETLLALKIPFVAKIISAHRTPERMYEFAKNAEKNIDILLLRVQVEQLIYLVWLHHLPPYQFSVFQ